MSRRKTRKLKRRKPGKTRKPSAPPRPNPKRMDLTAEELEEILERAETSALSQEDREKLKATRRPQSVRELLLESLPLIPFCFVPFPLHRTPRLVGPR